MKLNRANMSVFWDTNFNEVIIGLKGNVHFNKNAHLSMLLAAEKNSLNQTIRAKLTGELNFWNWSREKKRKILKPILDQFSEPKISNTNKTPNFPQAPADLIENFITKLEGFPLQSYENVAYFIAVAQQNNHLLIIIGVICFIVRLSLKARLKCSYLRNQPYKAKKFGKFRYEYIYPGYLVTNTFIRNMAKLQSKNENRLDLYQITNDFKYYRTKFEFVLGNINRVIYFYFFLPIFSTGEKIALSYIADFIPKCLSFFSNYTPNFVLNWSSSFSISVPVSIKNFSQSQFIINIIFLFIIIFFGLINYFPVSFVNKNLPKVENFVFDMCLKLAENPKYFAL